MTDLYDIRDDRFARYVLGNSQIELIASGMRWTEGPVYFGDTDCLYFSDIPGNRIMQWSDRDGLGVYRQPSDFANGQTRDRQGRRIVCEHGTRRLTRTEWDGRITILADRYRGMRLNSPNDATCKSDGTIWFSDPPYGIMTDYEGYKSEPEIGSSNVYRLDPETGDLLAVADDFDGPNGLCFSPDESVLYVSDTGIFQAPDGRHHIRAFDVADDGTLKNGRVFAEIDPGKPDGFRVDTDGNVWTSAGDGVHCYSPEGELLGKLLISETVANVTFGGPRKNRLFICASTSVYAIYLNRKGAQWP